MQQVEKPGIHPNLGGAVFRANHALRLVALDKLTAPERALLDGLERDADCVCVLRPRSRRHGNYRAVDRATAELFRRCLTPRRLPARFRDIQDEATRAGLARLVLDGVLEVRAGRAYVSGLRALREVIVSRPAPEARHPLNRLAHAALEYGARLPHQSGAELSARLYFFNRTPVTPELRRAIRGSRDALAYLRLDLDDETGRLLRRSWSTPTHTAAEGDWLMFLSRAALEPTSRSDFTHKLYLSPVVDGLRATLHTTIAVLASYGAPPFKVGSDAYSLARPDKLVVYFTDRGQLLQCAAALRARLSPIAAQGVPFTAPLDETGLLSCGTDPPAESQLLRGRESDSWRTWLTDRLASSLLLAKRTPGSPDAVRDFALARLALDDVDTSTWTPTDAWSKQFTHTAH
jgi:hypothetical protein